MCKVPVDSFFMAASDSPPEVKPREKHTVGLVESAGADGATTDHSDAPAMAVSIAGVSTACSKDALLSSAKAVRKTLAPE